MAKQTVALDVTLNSQQAEQSVGSFKKQLREANAELIQMSEQFGAASTEAVTAAKKVAGLKDAIGDAKALAETFNPDKKFVALGGALQGATAGFSALQGAMGLFGSENKKVEDALLKVQSAMALQQGISGVFGAIDSFKLFGAQLMTFNVVQKSVTAAQWLWNAAMAANPIGALVAVIAAVVAGIVALTSWFIKSAKASEDNAKFVRENTAALEAQIDAQKRASDQLKRNSDYQIAYAKASGESAEAVRALEQKLAMEAIAFARSSAEAAKNTYEKQQNQLASLKAADAAEEDIKAQEELTKNAQKNLENQYVALKNAKQAQLDLTAKHNIDIRQEQTNAHQKELEKNKEKNDKLIEQQKEFNQKQKDLKKQINDELSKLVLSDKDYSLLKLKEEYEERIKLAKNNKELLSLIELDYSLKKNEVLREDEDKTKNTETKKSNLIIDATRLTNNKLEEARQSDIANTKAAHEIKMLLNEQQIEAASAVGDALGNLANLIGKQTGVGKALAVAQATISTIISAQQAYQRGIEVPYIGMVLGPINAAIAVASGIANVKKILSVQVPGAAGGGGSTPNISASAARAPIAPQAQSTRLDQTQVNQIGNAVSARAYVLESDGASAQERRVRIERAARIN